ncbi:MAG: methyl-accepting chemotaxis protein [Comamonadaceae bacterium]|nr:MAG: methyl-accepting chemotaxis protein [Comamonadaceae bacterium]
MKGVLAFLEKAGLVKTDGPLASDDAGAPSLNILDDAPPVTGWLPPATRAARQPSVPASQPSAATPAVTTVPGVPAVSAPLVLDDIYAAQGVPDSIYPAERLLRLLEGLGAMDESTRLMAIRAMDAADESWTIADPLADADAKVKALAAHAGQLQAGLAELEADTQARLEAAAARQEEAVGTIRKQIADMEALLARETARGAQETAAQQASLQAAREQTTRQLGDIDTLRQRLQGLATQFSAPAAPAQE